MLLFFPDWYFMCLRGKLKACFPSFFAAAWLYDYALTFFLC